MKAILNRILDSSQLVTAQDVLLSDFFLSNEIQLTEEEKDEKPDDGKEVLKEEEEEEEDVTKEIANLNLDVKD